jgi:putative transposase
VEFARALLLGLLFGPQPQTILSARRREVARNILARVAESPHMTLPRRVAPGVQYMITRRCSERMFLLKPDAKHAAMFAYLIAEAAERHAVLVHAAVFMSNHLHIVATDTRGNMPEFCHLLFGQMAKAVNAATGHIEAVFAKAERPNLLQLVTEDAVAHEIAYLLANPVTAGLVEKAHEWPGLITKAEDIVHGAEYAGHAGDNAYLKARECKRRTLKIEAVPGVIDNVAFASKVAERVAVHERAAREQRRVTGRKVLGAAAVQRQHWRKMPKTGARLFGLKPTIAAARRLARIAALGAVKDFRRKYREALMAYRQGRKTVEFPHGTWRMMRLFGARIAAPLPAAT